MNFFSGFYIKMKSRYQLERIGRYINDYSAFVKTFKNYNPRTSCIDYHVFDEIFDRQDYFRPMKNEDLVNSKYEVVNLIENNQITDLNCLADTLRKVIIGPKTKLNQNGIKHCKKIEFLQIVDNDNLVDIDGITDNLRVLVLSDKTSVNNDTLLKNSFKRLKSLSVRRADINPKLLDDSILRNLIRFDYLSNKPLTLDVLDKLKSLREIRLTHVPESGNLDLVSDIRYLHILVNEALNDRFLQKCDKLKFIHACSFDKSCGSHKWTDFNHMKDLETISTNGDNLTNDSFIECEAMKIFDFKDLNNITDINQMKKLIRVTCNSTIKNDGIRDLREIEWIDIRGNKFIDQSKITRTLGKSLRITSDNQRDQRIGRDF